MRGSRRALESGYVALGSASDEPPGLAQAGDYHDLITGQAYGLPESLTTNRLI